MTDVKIRFNCDACGKMLKVQSNGIGKSGKCPSCSNQFIVPAAFVELDESNNYPQVHYPPPIPQQIAAKSSNANALLIAGYVCGGLSLLILPPALGIAGTAIGIVNLTKGRIGHGIAQICIAVTCAWFGMIFGAAVSRF